MRRSVIVLGLLLFVSTVASFAQARPGDSPGATPTETPPPGATVTSNDLTLASEEPALQVENQPMFSASLGDSIELKTSSKLGEFLNYAAKQNKSVTLFLNGNDTGIPPEKIDRKANRLRFHLERNGDNKKVWLSLLRFPFRSSDPIVAASVGIGGGIAKPSDAKFTLVRVKWAWYAYFWLALMIGVLVLFGWLVLNRDILRDGPKPCPYSLGRCQMAWWFFLILAGYVLIWLISGDQDTITESLLALMGISAGTALGAALIESTSGDKDLSDVAAERLAFLAEQQNRQNEVAAAQAAAKAAPTNPLVQKQLADANAALAAVDAKLLEANNRLSGITKRPQTRGFFRDILSDSNGTVGLHRFQIFVWTIVLGIIFIVSVVTELSMPVFSATLLTTMGISAGTYLGFKFPEK